MRHWLVVPLLALAAGPVFAADCAFTIEGNDAMQFNTKAIEVPASCKDFTVTLKHVGKLPKASMGHNWVLSTAADEPGIVSDAIKAGAGSDYLKADDARVIAHTKMVGGGESADVTFSVSKLKAGDAYMFFCSFPGHAALMKGTLTVK
ncbi:MAG: azurin [Lysobacteraceae bacterium]|nr:MAG: azurin [Xanthomonadaceae bacterium]